MVLAAGRGQRMRPLSNVVPKPALPLPGGPVVASAIELAASVGVRRVVVNIFHLHERMASALSELERTDIEIAVSTEDRLMGTSGGLALARHRGLLGNGASVLVINADGLFDLDLEPLIHRHTVANDRLSLAVLPHPDPVRWSRIVVDDGGSVTGILPPGETSSGGRWFLYPGVMLVAEDAIEALEVAPHNTPETLWWPALETRRLGAAAVTGSWHEVGTPEDYIEAVQRTLAGANSIHATAIVSPHALVTRSLIGRRAAIDAGATVTASVVGEGARIGRGAMVNHSVILGDHHIEGGSTLVGRYIATPT
jgi:mannose-1-phosphate guanylyltransferase